MTTRSSAAPAGLLRYAAFTRDPEGGNPAGVVLDATGLDDSAMLRTAADLGYSETAFLTGPPDHGADRDNRGDGDNGDHGLGAPGRAFTVRYFSPLAEVPFCGHATVAAAVALADRIGPGPLVFATRSGTVPVEVDQEPDGTLRATLTSVRPYLEDVGEDDVAGALTALGWRADELDATLPPRIAYAGARHLVLAAATRARLADLSYDFERLADHMRARNLVTVQLVWRESAEVFHVRNPFPVGGVVEDPATGAAAAAFGAYLRELGQAAPPAVLTLHQGDDMGRPGVLRVELRDGDPRVRVSGTAVPMPS